MSTCRTSLLLSIRGLAISRGESSLRSNKAGRFSNQRYCELLARKATCQCESARSSKRSTVACSLGSYAACVSASRGLDETLAYA